MRSATAAIVLAWVAGAFAGHRHSDDKSGSRGPQTQRSVSVHLANGERPSDPGGILYREHWGGFWGRVNSVAFSPCGRYLLSAGSDRNDGTVRLWDVETGEEMRRYQGKGHSSQYDSVAFSCDGKYALAGSYKATGSDPHAAWLWDIDTTSEVQRYAGHASRIVGGVSVGFSPDGRSVVTACVSGHAILWDTATGVAARRIGDGERVTSAAFSPSGAYVVTGARGGEIALWDADSGRRKNGFLVGGPVLSVEFSSDGQRILARGHTGVDYLDAGNGHVIHHLFPGNGTHAAALSPNGAYALIGVSYADRFIAGPVGGGRAELYDLSTGKKARTFEQTHALDGRIVSAAFSPDGRLAATGSLYGPIRLWDVATGSEIRAFYGHLGKGPDVAFHADGSVIVGSHIYGSLEQVDERMRRWLDRVRRQQLLTVVESD